VDDQAHNEHQLSQLRKEERSVSARRSRLHDRIDFLRAGGGAGDVALTLEELERQERELSRRRLELHERIEVLSSDLNRSAAGREAL
jgi:hypothetical protein